MLHMDLRELLIKIMSSLGKPATFPEIHLVLENAKKPIISAWLTRNVLAACMLVPLD